MRLKLSSAPLISHFMPYLQNYKEFKAKILDLQLEKYGLSFDIEKYTTSGWALGDENVIGRRAFNPSFIVWKKKTHLNRFFQAFERIQYKFENNFGLATFYGYLLKKHVLLLVLGFVGLGHICDTKG